jgi:hypothetical protein
MNTKHTPGPWTVRERADKGLSIKAGELCLIAKIGLQTTSYKENARLIAAAPELLEALERLVAWAIIYGDDLENDIEFSFAKKAIAKATGG